MERITVLSRPYDDSATPPIENAPLFRVMAFSHMAGMDAQRAFSAHYNILP